MSNIIKDQPPFDPDELPHVDIRAMRADQSRQILTREEADLEARKRLRDYYLQNVSEINRNRDKTILRPPTDSRNDADGSYDTIVAVPIKVETENIDGIFHTFQSIKTASENLGRSALAFAWLNFQADPRRERDRARELRLRAAKYRFAISEMFGDLSYNDPAAGQPPVHAAVAVDYMGAGATISQVRYNMAQGSFGIALGRVLGGDQLSTRDDSESLGRLSSLHNTQYVQLDADSSFDPNALTVVDDVLQTDKALFVNGALRYTGGSMELPLEDVAREEDNMKLLYVTETMRRIMFDSLPPDALHGYLPETGLGLKLGPLMTMGSFDVRAVDNESYLLQQSAKRALSMWYDTSTYVPRGRGLRPDIRSHEPYVSNYIAERLEHFVYYGDYTVSTSIRGLERMVREKGPYRLVGFDQNQGEQYDMWSDGSTVKRSNADIALDITEKLTLLNSVYSYFKDSGGNFSVERMGEFNDVLNKLFQSAHSNERIFWAPAYVPKDLRPKNNQELKRVT